MPHFCALRKAQDACFGVTSKGISERSELRRGQNDGHFVIGRCVLATEAQRTCRGKDGERKQLRSNGGTCARTDKTRTANEPRWPFVDSGRASRRAIEFPKSERDRLKVQDSRVAAEKAELFLAARFRLVPGGTQPRACALRCGIVLVENYSSFLTQPHDGCIIKVALCKQATLNGCSEMNDR